MKPTYEELARLLEEMLAGTSNSGECIAPEDELWERAFTTWEATRVPGMYYVTDFS